jgi:hypothetical protein
MNLFSRLSLVLLLTLFAVASAHADVSKLRGRKPVDLRPFSVIVVEDFADGVKKKLKNEEANARYHEEVVVAGRKIADEVARRLRESKAFGRVERAGAGEGDEVGSAILSGRVTEFRDANLAGRYIGIGTGAKVRIEASVRDQKEERAMGTMKGVYATSWIPGVANLIQSADRFIDGLSMRIADEVLFAKGAKRREETGRQGRLREKYKD